MKIIMRIYVKAVPRSGRNEVVKVSEGEYKVKMTAPPVEGKANEMLVELLADHFGVAKSLVNIAGGRSARRKIVDVGK